LEEAIEDSDCIVVLTDHSEFREMDPGKLANIMGRENIIDTRNILNKKMWENSGYKVKVIGNKA
jgi:UDP-N-acetyl-D-mannosaminuronic acid dehydrogenase